MPLPTGLSPCLVEFPNSFGFSAAACCRSYNPDARVRRFRPLRVRSPLLAESSLFLGLLRCFSSPTYLPRRDDGLATTGFPHSDIVGCLRLHTPDRRFSQCTTSFFGTRRQGIHRALFSSLAPPIRRRRFWRFACFYLMRVFCLRILSVVVNVPLRFPSDGCCRPPQPQPSACNLAFLQQQPGTCAGLLTCSQHRGCLPFACLCRLCTHQHLRPVCLT